MRILYCLNSLDVIGGIERVTINKCNYLTENGHDVAICVTDHRDNVQFIQPLSPKATTDRILGRGLFSCG